MIRVNIPVVEVQQYLTVVVVASFFHLIAKVIDNGDCVHLH